MQKRTVVMLGIICTFVSILNAQTEMLTWDYPIKLGSDEFRMMPYDEKVERSQPPKALLDNWNTNTLFNYCLIYPFNHVTFMYDNPNRGFRRMYDQSTVWQEFIRRTDALNVLVKYFEARPYQQLYQMSSEVRAQEKMNLFILEKLVSETDFTDLLEPADKRKLANVILQFHQSKKEYPEIHLGFMFNSSLCALVKIMESDRSVSLNKELRLVTFREKTQNEFFTGADMEPAIVSEVIKYIKH